MIKINFLGLRNSGKSLSCFVLANFFKKDYKTIILNFDYFSKYKPFINAKTSTSNSKINIYKNLDIYNLNVSKNKDIQIDYINELLNNFSKNYDVVLIDHATAFGDINMHLLNNSNLIICPFKIDSDIIQYKEKLLNIFFKKNIKFKNFKFLAILIDDNEENYSIMLKLRKQLLNLLFSNYICNYQFKNYSELLENKLLFDDYKQIYENIKKLI